MTLGSGPNLQFNDPRTPLQRRLAMAAGAGVFRGKQGGLTLFWTERDGFIIIRGEIAGFDSDGDMSEEDEEYHRPYEEDYNQVFGLPNENMGEADWIPSTTDSD